MLRVIIGFATATMIAATPGSALALKPTGFVDPMNPGNWEFGPIINGRNYSVGMPATPSADASGGWYFDIPSPNAAAGHVHYVTFRHGSLAGKSRLVLRYRLEMADGVQLVPTKESPGSFPSILTMYFQRRGDTWSGTGKFETYRWWATFASVIPLRAGDYELSVPLDGNWTAVQSSSASSDPKAFRDALREAERVGFTFGGGDGYGHGVYATGPARFVVKSFEVVGDTNFGVRQVP